MADILSQEEIDNLLFEDEQDRIDVGIKEYFKRILEIEKQYENSKIFKTKELTKLEGESFSIVSRTFDNLYNKLTKGKVHPRHYILFTIMILKEASRVSKNYSINRWEDENDTDLEKYKEISKKINELITSMSNM